MRHATKQNLTYIAAAVFIAILAMIVFVLSGCASMTASSAITPVKGST